MNTVPRLRMFAGPNGSGKTSIKLGLNKSSKWFGHYINPDELELQHKKHGYIELPDAGWKVNSKQLKDFFSNSTLKLAHSAIEHLSIRENKIRFKSIQFNSYHASVISDFLRQFSAKHHQSFSFETVMSNQDKIKLLQDVQHAGYRTYLYYVATQNAEINVERVKIRVKQGGHHVPRDKIIERYERSLNLLPQALLYSTRAYIFDSTHSYDVNNLESIIVAEIEQKDQQFTIKAFSDKIPAWVNHALEQFIDLLKQRQA